MAVDKGDTTWMLVSTILVILMTLPGLALFYGGLVRAKNMLSVPVGFPRQLALVMPLRVSDSDKSDGPDLSTHGERAYN